MAGKRDKKTNTFVVHINRREHSTWQGDVIWAEENRREVFRSAMELIRLIDGALDWDRSEDGSEDSEQSEDGPEGSE